MRDSSSLLYKKRLNEQTLASFKNDFIETTYFCRFSTNSFYIGKLFRNKYI
jgi:hypothetical protein